MSPSDLLLSSSQTLALTAISRISFHQSLSLPATLSHGPLRVTYAISGSEDENAPTVLLLGGMFGGRWIAVPAHHLALRDGVRVVCVDRWAAHKISNFIITVSDIHRPGFGGSTPVELSQRLSVWLETVPQIMKKLNTHHVALVAASSGTVFALHTVYNLPHILSPTNPYVVFLAPWVHPAHSKVNLMSLASHLPDSLIANYWNKLSHFLAITAAPVFESSSGVLSAFAATSSNLMPRSKDKEKLKKIDREEEDKVYQKAFGMTREEHEMTFKLIVKYIFAEDTTGANHEALLCLKKGGVAGTSMWGICEDYGAFVPALADVWKNRSDPGTRLKVEAYFAESDMMIGQKGQNYFEECWNEENCGDAIAFEAISTIGTDHDSVGDPMNGAIERIIREAKRSLGSS
jgi:pimeloyl-ACP methyl ester carboxylesterase